MPAESDALLSEALNTARERWKTVTVDDSAFLAWLSARLPSDRPLNEALSRLHVADLYLACGCALGAPSAITAFEREYFGELRRAVARSTRMAGQEQDIAQLLREKLFVARPEGPPKIAEYSGSGPLRLWLRVAVTRMVQNLATRGPREEAAELESLAELPHAGLDPELEHMRTLYRHQFSEAFREAAAQLSADDRVLLQERFMRRMSQEALAELYGVHVNTIVRWLKRAQETLEAEVRTALGARLGLQDEQLLSVLRLVRSQLDLSLAASVNRRPPDH